MVHNTDLASKIAVINDHFRSTFLEDQVHLTPGVMNLDDATRVHIISQVMTFDVFTPDNDPHGEHDFGSITISSGQIFRKLTCMI